MIVRQLVKLPHCAPSHPHPPPPLPPPDPILPKVYIMTYFLIFFNEENPMAPKLFLGYVMGKTQILPKNIFSKQWGVK